METQTLEPIVQELEDNEDLGALMRTDVVNTEKGLMRYFDTYETDEMSFYGRGGGKSIVFVDINKKRIDVKQKKLFFKKPYKTYSIWSDDIDYDFFDNKLQEAKL